MVSLIQHRQIIDSNVQHLDVQFTPLASTAHPCDVQVGDTCGYGGCPIGGGRAGISGGGGLSTGTYFTVTDHVPPMTDAAPQSHSPTAYGVGEAVTGHDPFCVTAPDTGLTGA